MAESSEINSESPTVKSQIIGHPSKYKNIKHKGNITGMELQQMGDITVGEKETTSSSSFNFSSRSGPGEANSVVPSTALHPLIANCNDFVLLDSTMPHNQISHMEEDENSIQRMEDTHQTQTRRSHPYPVMNSTLRSQQR